MALDYGVIRLRMPSLPVNSFFYNNKVKNLKNTNIRRWWSEIKNPAGVSAREGQWYAQLCDGHHIDNIETLCCKINEFFTGLTSNFSPLLPGDISAILVPEVPENLLVSSHEVFKALRRLKANKAHGPDRIPSLILKMFAFELSPILAELYNTSIKQGFLPSLLKSAVAAPYVNGGHQRASSVTCVPSP